MFYSTAWLDLSENSLMGTIPSEVGLLSNLSKSSVVWLLVVMIVLSCVVHCTLMLACNFFILQLGCISTTIISRANSRVLPLFMIVESPVAMTTTMIHADPFRETLMHSRGVVLYKIVYIIGLECTIFTLFFLKSNDAIL
jgi:hypothetical protein